MNSSEKKLSKLSVAIGLLVALSVAAGCAIETEGENTNTNTGTNTNTSTNTNQEVPINVLFDIGGAVALGTFFFGFFTIDEDTPLSDVTVTLTDDGGATNTATTSTEGLWEMQDFPPGSYNIRYEKQGFRTENVLFRITAEGETNIGNQFLSLGTRGLRETGITATTSVSGSTVVEEGNTTVADGFAGVTSIWDQSSPISVTFNKIVSRSLFSQTGPVCLRGSDGFALYFDSDGNGFTDTLLCAEPDNTRKIYSFAKANLDAAGPFFGAVTGLVADNDSATQYRISIVAESFTDIYGDTISLNSSVGFNVNTP